MGSSEGQQVFELKRILSADNIFLSARIQFNSQQIVALVTQDGDLILHYTNNDACPILRRIPWFLEREKRITSLAFQPAGTWLLVTGWDGFLHIVPALALVDCKAVCDQSWNPLDLTTFPAVTATPPTCCVWWQSTALGHQMAFVGTETGEIVLINLSSGLRLGSRKITGCLAVLHVCHDNSDSAYLLITCEDRQQWRVLLEDRDGTLFWPEESGKPSNRISKREEINSLLPTPSTRTRLQGLKQMSVEKLASIRQRLAETRSKATVPSPTTSSNVASRRGSSSSDGSARSSDASFSSSGSSHPIENLRCTLNAFLWPQTLRGRQTLSAHHAQSCFVSMLKIEDLEHPPPYGHKLPSPCRDVLVTERFLYVTDPSAKRVSVISSKLSECRRHDDLECNRDSVIDSFELQGDERILSLYRVSQGGLVPVVSASGLLKSSSSKMKSDPPKTSSEIPVSQERCIEREIQKLRGSPVDTCFIVTTKGVYHVVLKQCAVRQVLHHLLAGVDPDKASRLISAELLATVFGLDLQRLLDLAGDLQLSEGKYIKAVELYKLARCRQMKWIVKLAAGGHSAQLLLALQEGAMTSNTHEANPCERRQLANLAVLCQVQQLLSTQSKDIHDGFMRFLNINQYFDEQMAVTVIGQNNLWPFLSELARHRGLLHEVLEIQTKMMSQAMLTASSELQLILLTTQEGFWKCISDVCLREALLHRPQIVRIHTHFVASCLSQIDLETLKRLAALYDPTDPALRPGFLQLLRSHRTREDSLGRDLSVSFDSLSVSSCSEDFVEPSPPPAESVAVMEDLVTAFILIMLHITHISGEVDYRYDLAACYIRPPKSRAEVSQVQSLELLSRVSCELSAGFSHSALVRNSGLLTWGQNTLGCLGVGPSMSRLSTPRPVVLFNSLRTRVWSVSCGRTHTLALTENGLYSWGSSAFGQLGLGDVGQSPHPRLIPSLIESRIVAITAGQYHSLALTSTGRVFSWGWGVHGQLGLGSVENRRRPYCIATLNGHVVSAIAAGHAHSLFLLSNGQVWGCGSSIFGQLGNGTTSKSSTPTPVCNLPESITTIATGYFHNLAISKSNRLYTWGSSPHMLRLQAQAQKRARLLLQEQTQQLQQPNQQQEKVKRGCAIQSGASGNVEIISLKDGSQEDESVNKVLNNPCTDRSLSPTSLIAKCPNNIRFNGPQEKFSDPLNATSLFPVENACMDVPAPDPCSSNHIAWEDESSLQNSVTESHQPIPDLLMEAVPKKTVDAVSSFCNKDNVSSLKSSEARPPPVSEVKDFPPTLPEVEASQSHLFPTLVDTSQVDGLIAEIACGCHHSALVTEEGRIYTWGRNMDGQLGHSGRKEAPIPTLVPELRAAQVSCGAEFTLALHVDGQVFGWGVNASGQVGWMPQMEPTKALEGKTITLSTTKRVIKIPVSVHNRVESPEEVPGIPPNCPTTAYANTALSTAPAAAWGTELGSIEEPPYGSLTLHMALQNLYPYYNNKKILALCLERNNLQAVGRISLLSNNISASLEHHLNSLLSSWKKGQLSEGKNIDNLKGLSVLSSANPVSQESAQKRDSICTPEHTSSSAASAITLTDENGEVSHTENSNENFEMHTFAVQGGNEEMSEGTDSEQTKSNQQPTDETSSLASVSLEEQDVASGASSCPAKLESDGLLVDDKIDKKDNLSKDSALENRVVDEWVEQEVVRLIELHIGLIEEEEEEQTQKRMSELLEMVLEAENIQGHKVIIFWRRESFPLITFENLVHQHWVKLSYPLAILLFCSESKEITCLAESLSSSFMVELCSSLCSNMGNRAACAQLDGLLSRLMAQKGMWGLPPTSPVSIEQVVELLHQDASGGMALHIEPLHDSLDNNNIVAFSCGHRLNWHDYHAEVLAARTEGSAAGAVLSEGEGSVFQHACPSCLAQYLQRIKL